MGVVHLSDGLGDAHVGDHVVGVVGGARHRRVRANERLADAAVDLDAEARDGGAGGLALEGLLVDRHDGHLARLEVDLDQAVDRQRYAGQTAGAETAGGRYRP